jgi:hypothetical protein
MLRVESNKGLHSGRLKNCLQILDRQGWKWTAVASTLAYYDTTTIIVVKRFLVQAPGPNVINLFCPQFMSFRNKLECFTSILKLFQPSLINTLA